MTSKRPSKPRPPRAVPAGKRALYSHLPECRFGQVEAVAKLAGCSRTKALTAVLDAGARAIVGPALAAHLLNRAHLHARSEASYGDG